MCAEGSFLRDGSPQSGAPRRRPDSVAVKAAASGSQRERGPLSNGVPPVIPARANDAWWRCRRTAERSARVGLRRRVYDPTCQLCRTSGGATCCRGRPRRRRSGRARSLGILRGLLGSRLGRARAASSLYHLQVVEGRRRSASGARHPRVVGQASADGCMSTLSDGSSHQRSSTDSLAH